MLETGGYWILLSGFCFLVFLYPYIIYPFVLRALPRRPYIPEEGFETKNSAAEATLLFCAYNEEQALPAKLENLRELKQKISKLKILAYSDCSDDATNELLCAASDILTPVIGETRIGKVLGMQKLVSMTDADIVIFTDANVIVDPDGLQRLIRYFDNPEIGSVAGTLFYIDDIKEARTATARVGGLYWRLEEYIKQLESETGSTMGADGAIFARRRNGYPQIKADLVDDMAASLSVLFDGSRCVSAPDVQAFECSVSSSSEEFRRKRRIACGSYSTYRYFGDQIGKLSLTDRFKFISHKILRWWGALFLIEALVFFLVGSTTLGYGTQALTAVTVSIALFWSLGAFGLPLISPLYEVARAVVATGVGVLESIVGRSYQTWNPAKTR